MAWAWARTSAAIAVLVGTAVGRGVCWVGWASCRTQPVM